MWNFGNHGFASLTKIKLRKSYAGSTSPVAVTAGKGLVGVWSCGCTVFPPLTFFLYGRPPGGFEGGGSFAYSATACVAVFGKGSLLKMADVVHTKGLFRVSLERFFGAPLFRRPEESSPYKMILGKRWSSILATCSAQRSWIFSNMASMLVISARSRTMMLVI